MPQYGQLDSLLWILRASTQRANDKRRLSANILRNCTNCHGAGALFGAASFAERATSGTRPLMGRREK